MEIGIMLKSNSKIARFRQRKDGPSSNSKYSKLLYRVSEWSDPPISGFNLIS